MLRKSTGYRGGGGGGGGQQRGRGGVGSYRRIEGVGQGYLDTNPTVDRPVDRSTLSRLDNIHSNFDRDVPATPLDDPRILPYPRLLPKNYQGTMTLDEELLRMIISFFTIKATSTVDFRFMLEKIRKDAPHLINALTPNESRQAEFLWSYIRCYSEQFGVDQDPRYPYQINYLSKCKIVAKGDKRRYEREFAAGTLRPIGDIEKMYNAVRYDINLERRAVTHFKALFYQLRCKNFPTHGLDIKKIGAVFRPACGVPADICAYVGVVEDFMFKRFHFFNNFGGQVDYRKDLYIDAIRKVTKELKDKGGRYLLEEFKDWFMQTHFISDEERAALCLGVCDPTFDEFLIMLFQHKLLFQMYTREGGIRLRHDVIPDIFMEDVESVPPYKCLEQYFAQDIQPPIERPPDSRRVPDAPEENGSDSDDGYYGENGYDEFYGTSTTQTAALARAPVPFQAATAMASGTASASASEHVIRETFDNAQLLAGLQALSVKRMASMNANQNMHPNVSTVMAQPNVNVYNTGMPSATNGDLTGPRRLVIRGGARPPRASIRCRLPMPGRPPVMTGPSTIGYNLPADGGRDVYQQMADELEAD